MNTLIIVLSISVILIIGMGIKFNYNYNQFKKHVKYGDPVKYYINENSDTGMLLSLSDKSAIIKTISGDIRISRDDIYPVLGYKYKK